MRHALTACIIIIMSCTISFSADTFPPIPRKLPPPGKELPANEATRLRKACDELLENGKSIQQAPLYGDVAIFHKALDLALRFDEFYDPKKDIAKGDWCLSQAKERLTHFKKAEWTKQRGAVLRGFISAIDGSAQPYGVIIPEKLNLSKPVPLYVWLHGRGDKDTDIHFMQKCAKGIGPLKPDHALVMHVFGRQCVGYKNAGETDVFEAIDHVSSQYPIDKNRIALMGFSMGGAGAKHLGAHFADHFAVMHTGAGFAETQLYQNLTPNDVPPYEAVLWGQYDTPDYVRNLFNIPVIAYSGEDDSQMKAGIILGKAYEAHGKHLEHLIAPKTGHKYQPDYLKQVVAFVDKAIATGRQETPDTVYFQTKSLRYAHMYWVEALQLGQHWQDSRVDAQVQGTTITATTKNITRLRLSHPSIKKGSKIKIDNHEITVGNVGSDGVILAQTKNSWSQVDQMYPTGLSKRPGLQGPIDDAFVSPFLVVLPSKACADAKVDSWVKAESHHFIFNRWPALMRGDVRVKKDSEVSADDIKNYNLVVWGDDKANSIITKLLPQLPLKWDTSTIAIGSQSFKSAGHVPVCIYPNPLNPDRYIVLNSGLTFRENHDRTNSQQNPKLPDWAVLDLKTPPNDFYAGDVVAADFFDESWQAK